MSYAKIFVEHYGKVTDNTWSSEYTVIDAYDVTTKTAMGDKKNTFQFKVLNVNNKYSTFFETYDKINIYMVMSGDTYTSDDLIMSGVVKSVSRDLNSDLEEIVIDGVDYSEVVMGAISFVDVEGKNGIQVIQDAINKTNSLNSAGSPETRFKIGWNSDNPTAKYNPSTGLYDGDAFPVLSNERHFYKSLKSIVERMLGPDYLEDGRYFWYINTANEFVVRKRIDTISEVNGERLTLTEGQDFYGLKIGVDNSEVRNWIIWKGGHDPKGYAIQNFVQNPISMTKHGIRPYILIDGEFNTALMTAERSKGQGMSASSLFPSVYPYTSVFTSSLTDSKNEPTVVFGNNVTVDNDEEWNYAVRREIEFNSKAKAERYLDLFDNGYLKVTIDMPFNTTYQVGQVVELTAERFGFTAKSLRLHEVNQSINGTRLIAQEDEATI